MVIGQLDADPSPPYSGARGEVGVDPENLLVQAVPSAQAPN
jgi:hypothetical protein